VIARVAQNIREAVGDSALARIVATPLYEQTTCMVCGRDLPAGEEGNVSAVVLRDPAGETRARYAHQGCAASRLIDVPELPTGPAPALAESLAVARARSPGVAWSLVGRKGRMPNVALLWDLEASPAFADRPQAALRDLLALGLRQPTRSVLRLEPRIAQDLELTREDHALILSTPLGAERLEVDDPETSFPMLEIAAAQGRLLVVAGADLRLDLGDLAVTDRQVRLATAACGQVAYRDDELRPGHSRKRKLLTWLAFGRGAVRQLR